MGVLKGVDSVDGREGGSETERCRYVTRHGPSRLLSVWGSVGEPRDGCVLRVRLDLGRTLSLDPNGLGPSLSSSTDPPVELLNTSTLGDSPCISFCLSTTELTEVSPETTSV